MAKTPVRQPGDGLVKRGGPNPLELVKRDGESNGRTLARTLLDPVARHASLSSVYGDMVFGGNVRLRSPRRPRYLATNSTRRSVAT